MPEVSTLGAIERNTFFWVSLWVRSFGFRDFCHLGTSQLVSLPSENRYPCLEFAACPHRPITQCFVAPSLPCIYTGSSFIRPSLIQPVFAISFSSRRLVSFWSLPSPSLCSPNAVTYFCQTWSHLTSQFRILQKTEIMTIRFLTRNIEPRIGRPKTRIRTLPCLRMRFEMFPYKH